MKKDNFRRFANASAMHIISRTLPATNVRNGGQISVRNEILEPKVSDAK
jgi:hypothetical protein